MCTIQNDAHGNPPLGSEHSEVNGIFVYLLYGRKFRLRQNVERLVMDYHELHSKLYT